jgi:16S rRNA (guanine1207-N2)-methyltransferase
MTEPNPEGLRPPAQAHRSPSFQHYFSESPRAPPRRRELRFLFQGRPLRFLTDSGVFASEALDPGTALLIENMMLKGDETVLDLGCGWGAIGIAAALSLPRGRVWMTDVNRRAIRLAKENAVRNGVTNVVVLSGPGYEPVIGQSFDLIASNPPYRAGRPTVLELLSGARSHLKPGGRLLVVGKGGQGILFYQRVLKASGGTVTILGRRGGYRVLETIWTEPPETR